MVQCCLNVGRAINQQWIKHAGYMTQYWPNFGQPSTTLAQHHTNTGRTSLVRGDSSSGKQAWWKQYIPESSSHGALCKTRTQYLLTCKVSRYWVLVVPGSEEETYRETGLWHIGSNQLVGGGGQMPRSPVAADIHQLWICRDNPTSWIYLNRAELSPWLRVSYTYCIVRQVWKRLRAGVLLLGTLYASCSPSGAS